MSISRAKRYSKKHRRKQTNAAGGKGRFKRGFYRPINEDKYKMPMNDYMNSGPIPEYRSSWELKLMKWCDMNPDIEYWTCEPFAIQYVSPKDNKVHRYFPDFLVKFKDGKKVLIEVKPESQHEDPVNLAKWEAAKKFCRMHDLIWRVMGETALGV